MGEDMIIVTHCDLRNDNHTFHKLTKFKNVNYEVQIE